MDRPPKTLADAVNLLRTCELLTAAVRTVVDEWAKEAQSPSASLPSQDLHEAQRTVLAATGILTELVSEPQSRVVEVACQYWESRALAVATERRIPDLLATAGTVGASAKDLGSKTGIEHRKLSRILRCLCSIHVFREIAPDVFTNNGVSAALLDVRGLMLLDRSNLDLYTASDHLPTYLLGPNGHSYSVEETAWQSAIGTTKPRWDWLEEEVMCKEACPVGVGYPGMPAENVASKDLASATKMRRPEHEIFSLAMVGGGRIFGAAHPYDYPWSSLGEATVVDVGGGLGGFDIQLSRLYPKLKFVVQDRGPVLQRAQQTIWPKEAPAAFAEGRVQFVEHDFFNTNPVSGAEVYWLRYILHDWSDDYCVRILSAIRAAMAPHSRILICDQVMNTTDGCSELKSAPKPLLPNYGYYTRYSHQRDLCLMGIINGIERTPAQFKVLIEKAGMKLEKIWECRSQVSVVEVRLRDAPPGEVGEVVNRANGTHGMNGHHQ
ncbi:MAG: hypothetical protein Q9180_002852 [Flavoplaca navasiana]